MGLFYLVRYLINLESNYRFTLNEFGGGVVPEQGSSRKAKQATS
jgi:hypothetical protein